MVSLKSYANTMNKNAIFLGEHVVLKKKTKSEIWYQSFARPLENEKGPLQHGLRIVLVRESILGILEGGPQGQRTF